MISFSYNNGWDNHISAYCDQTAAVSPAFDPTYNVITWAGLRNASTKDLTSDKHSQIQSYLSNSAQAKNKNQLLAMLIIEKILQNYDAEDCIHGLFNALFAVNKRISPFIATHNYCIKIQNIAENGTITFNISPIYHLGPEYMQEYKQKHGFEIDRAAVIGLIEVPACRVTMSETKKFSLGIDAGIVFNKSKIPHNHNMTLKIDILEKGVVAALNCESQTTSKTFKWEQLGIKPDFSHIFAQKGNLTTAVL